MPENAKYRIGVSGAELLRLLQAIPEKIDKTSISQLLEDTNADTVPSSKIFNQYITTLQSGTQGEGLKAAIEAIPDCNIFTDAQKEAIENVALRFIGTTANTSTLGSINTSSFTGGEVILILSNEYGNADFLYWSTSDSEWKATNPLALHRTVTVDSAGASVIKSFPKASYTVMTMRVTAKSNTKFHKCDIDVGVMGDDVFPMAYAELCSEDDIEANGLFDVSANYVSATETVEVVLTTKDPNTNIQAQIISAY